MFTFQQDLRAEEWKSWTWKSFPSESDVALETIGKWEENSHEAIFLSRQDQEHRLSIFLIFPKTSQQVGELSFPLVVLPLQEERKMRKTKRKWKYLTCQDF
jgi:hypothetical protein